MLKRIYKIAAVAIVFTLVISMISPITVSASQVACIESERFTNNMLSSKWDSMYGLNKVNTFKQEKDRYVAKNSSSAAMQQIIKLGNIDSFLDNNCLFFGFGLDVIVKNDVSLLVNIDFYEDMPTENNYDNYIETNRIQKIVNPNEDMVTSLKYNMYKDGVIGSQDQAYLVPQKARYARVSIMAHSNIEKDLLIKKLEVDLYNINFGVSDIKTNIEGTYGIDELNQMQLSTSDEVTNLIRVVNMTEDWTPTAQLQMSIISDEVKEVVLPNGVAVNKSTDYYVTSNGEYTFKVILNNGIWFNKTMNINNIDNIDPSFDIKFNSEQNKESFLINAYDGESGVKDIKYAWSKKETLPLAYETLNLEYINYINEIGDWYLHLVVEDFAGNITKYCSEQIQVKTLHKNEPIIETDNIVVKQIEYKKILDDKIEFSFQNEFWIKNSSENSIIKLNYNNLKNIEVVSEVQLSNNETGPPGISANETLL
ncbi:MAG: hypothetical protein K0R15_1577 [Clostridiales bacterium]|jgi:hypothetical protein|nr:hypothetical protein [Clostridiales bacterium]